MTGTVSTLIEAGFGLAAGIGITAVGPGGVLVTVGLFLVSGLSPAGSPERRSSRTSPPAAWEVLPTIAQDSFATPRPAVSL